MTTSFDIVRCHLPLFIDESHKPEDLGILGQESTGQAPEALAQVDNRFRVR